MEQEKEFNLLTKRLLEEGYTAENHPDYVKVCTSAWGKELWQNLAGGFEYTTEYLSRLTFRTGCGLLVKGSRFSTGHMSYMGIEWIPENDNPVINCPYRKKECSLINPVLENAHDTASHGMAVPMLFCDCHQTEEVYIYEKSIEKVFDDEDRLKKQKFDAYKKKTGGHVCHWHMRYDYYTGEWKQCFDPMACARNCQKVGGNCDLTHKPVSKKKGNVFYDIRTSYIRKDGTLFDGEEVVRMEKGLRLFEMAKSMTICGYAEKLCGDLIRSRVKDRYHQEILLYGWKVEVLNIRAEQRESRDLMQDLQDIRDGIEVVHASDMEKDRKEVKRQKRKQAQEAKIKKLEKKLLEVGYDSLEEYSLDRVHADKWLGKERIAELEAVRQQNMEKAKEKPVQMSLFDIPGVMP